MRAAAAVRAQDGDALGHVTSSWQRGWAKSMQPLKALMIERWRCRSQMATHRLIERPLPPAVFERGADAISGDSAPWVSAI